MVIVIFSSVANLIIFTYTQVCFMLVNRFDSNKKSLSSITKALYLELKKYPV
jgi:hypothetical protein